MTSLFPAPLQEKVEASGVIAVLVIDDVRHAIPVARSLVEGGINAIELTLRTPAAIDALQAIRAGVPEMLIGVGTVLQPAQIEAIVEAGAAFGVAPGFNRRVMEAAASCGLPFAPGVSTATDIESALEFDCRLLKFFPAEASGGLAYLGSLAAPYAHLGIKYVPLGGLNERNMSDYLRSSLIGALGGSWIAPRELIRSERWSDITANAKAASNAVSEVRSSV